MEDFWSEKKKKKKKKKKNIIKNSQRAVTLIREKGGMVILLHCTKITFWMSANSKNENIVHYKCIWGDISLPMPLVCPKDFLIILYRTIHLFTVS